MLNSVMIADMIQHDTIKGKFVGDGMFAAVYERRDKTKVAKVSACDPGYIAYLDFMEYKGHRECFPTIYAVHQDNDALFVVIEKLEHLKGLDQNVLAAVKSAYDYKGFLNCFCTKEVRFRAVELVTEETFNMYSQLCRHGHGLANMNVDLHGDNVMFRRGKQGRPDTMVFTDPYYSGDYSRTLEQAKKGRYRTSRYGDDDYYTQGGTPL